MSERLSPEARVAVGIAHTIARISASQKIETEHLLLAIMRENPAFLPLPPVADFPIDESNRTTLIEPNRTSRHPCILAERDCRWSFRRAMTAKMILRVGQTASQVICRMINISSKQ